MAKIYKTKTAIYVNGTFAPKNSEVELNDEDAKALGDCLVSKAEEKVIKASAKPKEAKPEAGK